MSTGDETALWVQRAIGGDRVALKLLLTELDRPLHARLAGKIPKDMASLVDVDDIIQDTQIEVFRSIQKFEPRGPDSFHRWVGVLAIQRLHNAVRWHRAAKRTSRRRTNGRYKPNFAESSVALLDVLAAEGDSPSFDAHRMDAAAAIDTALDTLPEHYRQAVTLVHLEGRPVRDVAVVMGRSERAVQNLCRRALDRMRVQLRSASRFLNSRG